MVVCLQRVLFGAPELFCKRDFLRPKGAVRTAAQILTVHTCSEEAVLYKIQGFWLAKPVCKTFFWKALHQWCIFFYRQRWCSVRQSGRRSGRTFYTWRPPHPAAVLTLESTSTAAVTVPLLAGQWYQQQVSDISGSVVSTVGLTSVGQ